MGTEYKHPLRAFREANGQLSQAQAAELVGTTQAMWSRLENGKKHASPKLAKRIEEVTGVSRDSLMDFGDNDPDEASVSYGRRSGDFLNHKP